jgi:pyruvate kinase
VIRRTRIVCTIGPSSSSPAVLKNLLKAGMDVARLNFSHGDHATHRQAATDVRAAAEDADRPVALLGDLQGPKIRTGGLESAFQRLVRGRPVFLIGGKREAENEIEVSHPELVDALRAGDRVLIDDGRIELMVRNREPGRAECSVIRGRPAR